MRKIKEVLRLHSLGLAQRQIATSCAVGQATVSEYLKTAEAAGLRWPDIAEWSEDQVIQAVAPSREKPGHRSQSPEPDYGDIRHELQTNKHVTLQLLWEEYREKNPDGYRYSRFCDLYRGWLRRREVVCRLRRRHHSHLPWHGRRRDGGGHLRGGVGSQQLHLLRGDRDARLGRLDRRPHARLRVPGGRTRDRRPRQPEVGRRQSLPL